MKKHTVLTRAFISKLIIILFILFTISVPHTQAEQIVKDLHQGINLHSYPLMISSNSLTSDQLPVHLGIDGLVLDISRWDHTTGLFEITDFSGGPAAGDTFPIVLGEGYLINMNSGGQAISIGDFSPSSFLDLHVGINFVGFINPPSPCVSFPCRNTGRLLLLAFLISLPLH